MRSRTTKRFRELLAGLPEPIQRQAQEAYQRFHENPAHPSLRFKPISPRDPSIYSVRIGLHYRAIGLREEDYVLWIWIGSHADYDRQIAHY